MMTHYHTGDRIMYGTSGLCQIEDIKEMTYHNAQENKLYYILKPVRSSATIYVPFDSDP